MRIILTCGGVIRKGCERDLIDDYITRANQLARSHGYPQLTENEVDLRRENTRADETSKLLSGLPTGAKRIILDERGKSLTTRAMAQKVDIMRHDQVSELHFVIGPADGFDKSQINPQDTLWCLGKPTWPHKLLRVMLAEQIYRFYSIWAGTPYHRD